LFLFFFFYLSLFAFLSFQLLLLLLLLLPPPSSPEVGVCRSPAVARLVAQLIGGEGKVREKSCKETFKPR
jgi:hypothetical protein